VTLGGLRYILRSVDSLVDLQVAEHGPDARVVSVTGEVDSLTAPQVGHFLTAQLAAARLVVVNLDGVRFLSSPDCACCWRSTNSPRNNTATCGWCAIPRPPT
jgi:hypothetical protein